MVLKPRIIYGNYKYSEVRKNERSVILQSVLCKIEKSSYFGKIYKKRS